MPNASDPSLQPQNLNVGLTDPQSNNLAGNSRTNLNDPTGLLWGGSTGTLTQPQTVQQQYQSFVDQNAPAESSAISGMPTNYQAPQGAAALSYNSPLAGLTTINTAQSNPILQGQLQNINQLNQQAQGQGPSPATVAAQQQAANNLANTYALLSSQRGSASPALGMRAALEAKTQADQQAVNAATLGKTQEELNAQQQLTGALQGTQSQVQQGAQAQAQIAQQQLSSNQQVMQQLGMQDLANQQQTQLANLQAQLQSGQMNVNEYNDQVQALMAFSNNQLTANENYANLVANQNETLAGIQNKTATNNTNNMLGLVGAGIGAAGTAAGLGLMSDKNLKTNIKPSNLKSFLNSFSFISSNQFKLLEQPL